MNKARHRRTNTASSQIYVESTKVKLIETESRMVLTKVGGGWSGEMLVKSTKFQLHKMNKSWKSLPWLMIPNQYFKYAKRVDCRYNYVGWWMYPLAGLWWKFHNAYVCQISHYTPWMYTVFIFNYIPRLKKFIFNLTPEAKGPGLEFRSTWVKCGSTKCGTFCHFNSVSSIT